MGASVTCELSPLFILRSYQVLIGQDLESFQKHLRAVEVPEKYAREYAIRKRMYDADCGGGPLGPLAVIEILRSCGFKPAIRPEELAPTNWDNVKLGTRVEMLVENTWQPGELLGFGDLKNLHVRLDHDPWIKECLQGVARVAADQTKPVFEAVAEPQEVLPPAPLRPEEIPGVYADEYVAPPDSVIHWNLAKPKPGEEVWLEINGDVVDAKFVRDPGEANKLVVEIDGVEHTVEQSAVHIIAPAVA